MFARALSPLPHAYVVGVIHQLPLHLLRNVDERVARDAIDRFLHRGVGLALGLLDCACEDEKE